MGKKGKKKNRQTTTKSSNVGSENQPFKELLKEFSIPESEAAQTEDTTSHTITSQEIPTVDPTSDLDDDDLFMDFVDGVKPLDDKFITVDSAAKKETKPRLAPVKIQLQQSWKSPILTSEERDRLRRFQRSKSGMSELYLRGLTREEAQFVLEEGVFNNQNKAMRWLRVITGRGYNSPKQPVLKEMLFEWLQSKSAINIVGFARELQGDGDFGSVLLELKNLKR